MAMAVASLILSNVSSQAQLSLNFSSSPGGPPAGGSTIQFNGTNSSFQFNIASTPYSIPNPPFAPFVVNYYVGSQWSITSETGGTGSALNLLGWVNSSPFTNSPFNYGPIVTNGIDETANVLGPLGMLQIYDNAGNLLTGTVDWEQVATHGFGGAINASLTVNITNLVYLGSNPDLQTLAADSPGSMDLTFQFSPGMTLGDLTSGPGPYMTSYSGSLSVPEPTSLGLGVLGLAALAGFKGLKRKKRF